MDPRAVYAKSEKGWAEIHGRSLRLDRAARFLLVATDGRKDLETLARQCGLDGRMQPVVEELLRLGLIVPAASVAGIPPAPVPRAAPVPGSEALQRAFRFLNEAAPELMGREAERFLARLTLCERIDQVLALIPDYRAAVARRHGFTTAEVAARKLLDAIGPLPDGSGVVR